MAYHRPMSRLTSLWYTYAPFVCPICPVRTGKHYFRKRPLLTIIIHWALAAGSAKPGSRSLLESEPYRPLVVLHPGSIDVVQNTRVACVRKAPDVLAVLGLEQQ